MPTTHADTARRILDHIESIYVAQHDYAAADPREFGHLDLKFYDRARTHLESRGFRHLADIEDRTLSSTPGNILHRTMIRILVSDDGSINAALFHPKLNRLWLRLLLWVLRKSMGRTIDLETEFTDGTFICTTNAITAAAIELPPQIDSEFWPWATPADFLIHRHRERLAGRLAANPGLTIRAARDLAEVHASQHRMNALKAAYRGEIGGISRDELTRLAPDADEDALEELHAEIQSEAMRR